MVDQERKKNLKCFYLKTLVCNQTLEAICINIFNKTLKAVCGIYVFNDLWRQICQNIFVHKKIWDILLLCFDAAHAETAYITQLSTWKINCHCLIAEMLSEAVWVTDIVKWIQMAGNTREEEVGETFI